MAQATAKSLREQLIELRDKLERQVTILSASQDRQRLASVRETLADIEEQLNAMGTDEAEKT